jgi:hypothetical protein
MPGVDTHFVGRVDKEPNEIELGVVDNLGELNRPHGTSGPLDDPRCHALTVKTKRTNASGFAGVLPCRLCRPLVLPVI